MDKKLLILTSFLVFTLISLSFVSATENSTYYNQTNPSASLETFYPITENADQGIPEYEANEIISYPNMKNLNSSTPTLGNSHTVPTSSFSNIQNAINDAEEGDTLILSGSYYDNNKQIRINKDKIIIKGKSARNKAVLDARMDKAEYST